MPNSRSPASYHEQQMYLENAMSNPGGLELAFATDRQAANWLGRCHSYRALMRGKYYPADDRLHATTPWDVLLIWRRGSKVYITHDAPKVLQVCNHRTGEPVHIIDIDAIDRELTEKKRGVTKTTPAKPFGDEPPLTIDDLDWKPLDN